MYVSEMSHSYRNIVRSRGRPLIRKTSQHNLYDTGHGFERNVHKGAFSPYLIIL
ncbi:hypothetical protein EYZ11_002451 [Aspergillus tanneri]|uniref:Uncharacterized protein n=1 Tax=Aspergillus tanneri TaxID=1220188 RepID=A0A4S3JQT3_9EURO|nr:hypothetical protein EYZ11_002451 [Aspergillus tanneri]